MDIPFRQANDGILIDVKVTPRSSKKGVDGVKNGVLSVRLTAPPADGEANAQLVEVLADHFDVRKSDVEILKGASSRNKTVKLRGIKA
ncbi:MAG TPA: DUF167 domain-containing protein [Dissulfurispiraceae bacterium]|nr:DUF167 domain-containing protein [Dissulfurispiraceae bacterium]